MTLEMFDLLSFGYEFVVVTLITYFAAMFLARYASAMKLIAHPGEHRQHAQATPMVGGIAISVGLSFGILVFASVYISILPALLLLSTVGAIDDRYNLSSSVRFLAQGLAIYLMVSMTDVELHTLGNIVPDSTVYLGSWSLVMTIFASIGVINAVNMSDGHDGLAGSLILVVLLSLLLSGVDPLLIIICIATLVGFLILNLRAFRARAKVFMGDAGSTMLGLLLAYLLIQESQSNDGIRPVTALWLLALPLIDAVAVLLVRPLRGRSPFTADRIHYHHQLVDRGVSVNTTVAVAVFIQSVLAAVGIWAWKLKVPDHLQLTAFLILFACYFASLIWFTRDKLSKSMS